MSCLINYINI